MHHRCWTTTKSYLSLHSSADNGTPDCPSATVGVWACGRVPRLALVGDEPGADGDEEDATPRLDPDDGGQRESAVGIDVKHSKRIFQAAH